MLPQTRFILGEGGGEGEGKKEEVAVIISPRLFLLCEPSQGTVVVSAPLNDRKIQQHIWFILIFVHTMFIPWKFLSTSLDEFRIYIHMR